MSAAVNIFDLLKKKTSLGDALTGQTELGFSKIPPFLKGVRGIFFTCIWKYCICHIQLHTYFMYMTNTDAFVKSRNYSVIVIPAKAVIQ